jgi:bacterioferritin
MAKRDRDSKPKKASAKGKKSGTGASAGEGAGATDRQLLADLNIDLAHEYAAIISYRTYASQVQGQWRMELRQFFEAEIPDELLHAQLLADKIVALGGTPTTVPAPVKPAADAKEMLRNALEDEIETIARYVARRKQAEALGHHGLAIDLDDLIQDESGHRDEIKMVLRRWDSG